MTFYVNLPMILDGVVTALIAIAELKRFVIYLCYGREFKQAMIRVLIYIIFAIFCTIFHFKTCPRLCPKWNRDNVVSFRVYGGPPLRD